MLTYYIDMDEVLVDFRNGASAVLGESIFEYERKHGKVKLMRFLDNVGSKFWENLQWASEGMMLWTHIIKSGYLPNTYILSKPTKSIDCCYGKILWCQKNLGIPKQRVLLQKYKSIYAGSEDILIDDNKKNIAMWKVHGGIAIQYDPDVKNMSKVIELINSMNGISR